MYSRETAQLCTRGRDSRVYGRADGKKKDESLEQRIYEISDRSRSVEQSSCPIQEYSSLSRLGGGAEVSRVKWSRGEGEQS